LNSQLAVAVKILVWQFGNVGFFKLAYFFGFGNDTQMLQCKAYCKTEQTTDIRKLLEKQQERVTYQKYL